jgi:uncharacterized membrane protein YkvI
MPWTVEQEQEHMEDVTQRRFNFFLVFYAVVMAAALNTKRHDYQLIVLALGAIISILLALTVHRAHSRMVQCMKIIEKDPNHIKTITGKSAALIPVKGLIGWVIPTILWVSLLVLFILSYNGVIQPPVLNP